MENEIRKKKTTAPDTSVGADDGQPLHNSTENSISAFEQEINGDFQNSAESLDEIYRRMQRLTDPHYLHTISMTELYQTAYQSRPPIIDGLLYAGAYILAGAPKIGKSFLVAQIAYHVSTGEALWGYEVHPGTVLYLALEDDFQRIQSRMFMMYGVNDTDRLHFATAAEKIGNGLDEQLENFVREHPDTKLIIIDTMQKIREVGGEAYSYASNYEIIGRLKQFADKHCICVLTVHHTRKQPAGDSFEMISGTTGLLGCADGSLLMQKKKRTALDATIDVVGRDQQDQTLYLKKDAGTQIWNLEKVENELHKEPPDHVLEAYKFLMTCLLTSPCTICGVRTISAKKSSRAWSRSWMPCSTVNSTHNPRLLPPKNSGSRQGRSILTAVECRKAIAGRLLPGNCDRSTLLLLADKAKHWLTQTLASPVPIEKSAEFEMDVGRRLCAADTRK